MTRKPKSHCGYVAIVGRPNVGKSTLLNHVLGEKISITSHKPQTTRHQILGIKTEDNVQVIFVDTPGLHREIKHTLNRYMNRAASAALEMVDLILFMVQGLRWTEEDDWILTKLKKVDKPIILIVNKVDLIQQKEQLLPHLEMLAKKFSFADIIPISAKKGTNLDVVEAEINKLLPENPHVFPDDIVTDRNDRFLAAELIREKLTRFLHQELPYSVTVEIEQFKEEKEVLHISALIWLEKEGQKAIVIGEKGQQLKKIGQQARLDMEKLFGQKVFLRLWTKVKDNWSDDEKALRSLGYDGI